MVFQGFEEDRGDRMRMREVLKSKSTEKKIVSTTVTSLPNKEKTIKVQNYYPWHFL